MFRLLAADRHQCSRTVHDLGEFAESRDVRSRDAEVGTRNGVIAGAGAHGAYRQHRAAALLPGRYFVGPEARPQREVDHCLHREGARIPALLGQEFVQTPGAQVCSWPGGAEHEAFTCPRGAPQ